MGLCSIQADMYEIVRTKDFELAASRYASIVEDIRQTEQTLWDELDVIVPGTKKIDAYLYNLRDTMLIRVHNFLLLLIGILFYRPDCPIPLETLTCQTEHSTKILRTSAEAILLRVAQVIGAQSESSDKLLFGATKIIWPLVAITIMPDTLPHQKKRAEQMLSYMGSVVGVKQALRKYPGVLAMLKRNAKNMPGVGMLAT